MIQMLAKSIIVFAIISSSANALAQSPYFKLKPLNEIRMEGIERQTLDYSCGASALSLLLSKYFEDHRDEQAILMDITFHLTRQEISDRMTDGFSMLDLKNVATRLGYSAEGVMLPQQSVSAIDGPVIILLRRKNLNHFVVLKGVTQGRAFIADPVRGHLRIPLYELFSQWNGETLILGRTGFGLPKEHALSIPVGGGIAPEREVVRALQYAPAP
jgi:predicted double-glycine peptidase